MGPQDALALFDSLGGVDAAFLQGDWSGEEFPTGHPLDGLLAAWGWRGKRIAPDGSVHPLRFRTPGGGTCSLRAAPLALGARLALRLPVLKAPALARAGRPLLPVLATTRPQAHLRSVAHRGVATLALAYDRVPILDVLRRRDADTVLGLMEWAALAQPFFFTLRRVRPTMRA